MPKKETFLSKLIAMLKKNLKTIVIVLLILVIIFALWFVLKKYVFKGDPKNIYQVAVLVRDQRSGDKDKSKNLKIGDVLMHKKGEEVKWSRTERISYLIIKMNLTEEQAQEITSPVDRELTKDEIAKELEAFKEGREEISAEESDRFKEELGQRRETVKIRKYHIDMDEFGDFRANDLLASPYPFQDKVFDWKIVDKYKK